MPIIQELFQTGLAAHQRGDLQQAKQCYEEVISLESDHAEALHLLGVLSAQLHQYDAAITWIKKAITAQPETAVFYNNLGNALKENNNLEEALQVYRQALAIKPDYAEVHNNIANLYLKNNLLDKALEHYLLAISLRPDYIEARINLGTFFSKQQNWSDAIKQFEKVIEFRPNSIVGYWQLANIYLQTSDLDKAFDQYTKLITLQPRYKEAYNNMGVISLKKNDVFAALDYFQQALDIDSGYTEARSNIAAILLLQERYTEAVWHYEKYLELVPDDSTAHYNLAVATLALGNHLEAIENLKTALALDPNNADAYSNLAAIYLKMGKKAEAIANYNKAIELQPDNKAVRYLLDALSGKEVKLAPQEYIKNLFDNYAGYFDKQLQEQLQYKVPSHLFAILNKHALLKDKKLNILDLGCGTGLSGLPFKENINTLVGVDISPRMLAKAQEKNIYNELIESDILAYLHSNSKLFDLVICVDTLVYFGDLSAIFSGVYQALHSQGEFAFSVEAGNEQDYFLQSSGRFSHQQKYIELLAQQYKFSILAIEQVQGRLQAGEMIASVIYVLEKSY